MQRRVGSDDSHERKPNSKRKTLSYKCHTRPPNRTQLLTQKAYTHVISRLPTANTISLLPSGHRPHEQATVQDGDLYDVLAGECMEHLYDDSPSARFGEVGFLSFTRLHHLNLHAYEAELSEELVQVVEGKTVDQDGIRRVRKLLREYSAAIRGYDLVLQKGIQPPRGVLSPLHAQMLPEFVKLITRDGMAWDNGYIVLNCQSSWAKGVGGRIAAALLGGLTLIVPMLVMSLAPSVKKSLVTSSVCVVVVALVIALVSAGSWRDVLVFTAAYAAVLVVLLGQV